MQDNYSAKISFMRKPELLSVLGIANSTLYNHINDGLIPPAISLGARAVGYLRHEIDLLTKYMITSPSKAEIKAFVVMLVKKRKSDKELEKFLQTSNNQ